MLELFIVVLLGLGMYISLQRRFKIGQRTITGARARSVGCLLMLPIPLSFMVLFCWLLPTAAQYAAQYSTPEEMQAALINNPQIRTTTALIEILVTVGCVAGAVWLTFGMPPMANESGSGASGAGAASIPPGQLFTVRQASNFSRLSESQIMSLIRAGALPAHSAVDGYRIDSKALAFWMYTARGQASYNQGRYPDAEQDFDRAVRAQPKFGRSYAWRGLARLRLERVGGANDDFRQALLHSQDMQDRSMFTRWLNAPLEAPIRLPFDSPEVERIVSDWLAGVDTTTTASSTEPFADPPAASVTDAVPPPTDDNEPLRS